MRTRYAVSLCVLVIAVVITGAVLLAAYGVLRHVSISVEDTSLTRFALVASPATALAYNLSLMLVVRNPNWAINIKNKEPLEAAYSFDGQQFDRVQLSDKGDKQPARKTRVYRLVTGSDSDYVALGNAGVRRVQEAERDGDVRGGGQAHRRVQLHVALHQVQAGGHLPAQAAAHAAVWVHRCLREGQMQARQAGKVLLASYRPPVDPYPLIPL